MFVVPSYTIQRVRVPLTVSLIAYSAGDVIDGLKTISNAAATYGGQAKLVHITVEDAAKQTPALTLLFFNKKPTVAADNAGFQPTDAQMRDFIGHIKIAAGDYASLVDNAVATANMQTNGYPEGMPIKAFNAKDIYMVAVVTSTPTFVATTDLAVNVEIEKA